MNNIINKSKISGINLIGLIIGSALGAFILSVIVRVSFTISNNYQIIKAHTELEISSRQLNNFFTQAFSAAGYASSGNSSPISFIVNSTANPKTISFNLPFSVGINGALECSGQPATTSDYPPKAICNNSTNAQQTCLYVSLSNGASTTPSANSSSNTPGPTPTTCQDSSSTAQNAPIVSSTQFIDFSLVAITEDNSGGCTPLNPTTPTNPPACIGGTEVNNKVNNIEITPGITLSTSPQTYYNSKGIKLAILLRSQKKVFNTPRNVTYYGFNQEKFVITNDKYLYKLVVIQSPFFYGNTVNTTITKS